jgi:hypothetical protein
LSYRVNNYTYFSISFQEQKNVKNLSLAYNLLII